MEVNYQDLSPLQGWYPECNQDFRLGAKELNSLHPASISPSSNSIYDGQLDEWMEIRETLGYNGLEAFNDVILPDRQELGPDLKDHAQHNTSIDSMFNTYGYSNISDDFNTLASKPSHTSYESLVCEQRGAEPKVTIKLKKVKVPKKSNQPSTNAYPICDYEVLANTPPQVDRSPLHDAQIILPEPSQDNLFTFDTEIDISECSQELVQVLDADFDTFLNEEEFEFQEHPNSNASINDWSGSLTLKDALNMENADSILENYLSPPRSQISRQSPSPDHWASSPFSSAHEEVFSPASETSSQCSYSEEILSPSTSENYSVESVLPSVYSLEDVLDPPNHRSKSRKAKKPRDKMSPESRYLRKKEQNKQAALRYRAKKKQEDEELITTLKEEEATKEKLEKEYNSLRQEVQFMKKLMRETFIAKKLVPPDAFD